MSTKDHDDWMNPPKLPDAVWTDDTKKKPFLIEREGQASWPPGRTEWRVWARFATPKERDAAFKALRKEHPIWHLRTAFDEPWMAFA